ncbi:esterase [Mycobacterium sp. NPDC051804]|uniref:esterase n=1 Tax=Mycobacterium sp. NPDC051804 TaxID=3364295 RepID=UPI00378F98AE
MKTSLAGILAAGVVGATTLCSPAVAQTAEAMRGCVDLGGTAGASEICHVVTEAETYSIDISYPLEYPDQGTLTDYLTRDRDEFVDFVVKVPPRNRTYDYRVSPRSYGSGTAISGTASVVLERYGNTGAHPVTSFRAFNYDLVAHTPITLDTLFASGTDPVALLDPIVQRQMDDHWRGYEGPAPQNTLGDRVYQNFAITDDAVVFFIAQGMWLPEVAGPQEVSVPRSALASLLRSRFQR